MNLNKGENNLKVLIDDQINHHDMNEAQTRFHIIDKILFDCLGWDRTEVEVENNEDTKFTDYELGKPRVAIVEAKREGVAFEIPAESDKLVRDLRSIMRLSSEAKEAITQAQSYCSKRGVPIAIVTNGHQFISFLASRQDGTNVFDGKAIVFRSLEHFYDNFDKAWQLFSKYGLKEKHIYRYLSSVENSIPIKLSSKLRVYPSVRYRSETNTTLRQLSEIFLQDLIDSSEIEGNFLKNCYCESGALSQYALLSKKILEARYSSLFAEDEAAPHLLPLKDKKGSNFTPDILSEAISRRPIVLLGDVGVGKTSFVKNLMYNSAQEEFNSAIYIYIDLGSNASLTQDLKGYTLRQVEDQLHNKYNIDAFDFKLIKGVYASEIHRFSNGIWGVKRETDPLVYETKQTDMLDDLIRDKANHLKRCIAWYSKSTKRQIIISIDNADQRDFKTQQDAFIISQEFAKEWEATVFISVRPQTFFKSKRSGALAAYPHKIFTISPPRIDLVIIKRLRFALSLAEGKTSIDQLRTIHLNVDSLSKFLKALITSLSDNQELNEFLSNITGGNIRLAIELVSSFIGNPNIDADKIIRIMDEQGRYRVPLHEFTKSALLGEYSHFNPDTSVAMNIYEIFYPDPKEHFLVPILIAYLGCSGAHLNNDSFCNTDNIFLEMQNFGFTAEQISHALRRSTNKKLIETSQRVTFEEDVNGILIGDMPSSFRLTSIGSYHLNRWFCVFTYIDAMVFDTPILDESVRNDLIDNIDSHHISDRLFRSEKFRSYLLSIWNALTIKPAYFDYSQNISQNMDTFEVVRRINSI